MRIAYLSVSDQLGGSEIVLLEMIKGVRRLRPDWAVQVILPGRGPLLDRAEAAGADCVVLPMPPSLARLGEFGAGPAALAARLVPVALALPAYLHRLRTIVKAGRPAILHTNGFKAHIAGARARGTAKVVWHMHEYIGARRFTRSLLASHQRHVAAIVANSASVAADLTGRASTDGARYASCTTRWICRRSPRMARSRISIAARAWRRPPLPSCVSAWWRPSRAGKDTTSSCGPWRRCLPTCRSEATSSAARCTTPPAASTRWMSCSALTDRLGLARSRRLHRVSASRAGDARARRRRARQHASGAVRAGRSRRRWPAAAR